MLSEEETSCFLQAGDCKVHYHDVGEGFPLLLIHGGGPGASGWSNFSRNVDYLAKKWRVLVIDLPGYGKSGRTMPSGEVLTYLASTIHEFLKALNIERVHLVGNSLGGGTALKFTLDYPDKVSGLVLMGPGGGVPVFTPMPTEGIRNLFNFYAGTGPSEEKLHQFIDLLVHDRSEITEELFQQRYLAATRPEDVENPPLKWTGKPPLEDLWREGISQITQDVLIIHGREDRVVPLDSVFLLEKLIPRSRLYVMPECGHWAQWEKAEEFNYLLEMFLSSVASN